MKTAPVRPAVLRFEADGTPASADYDDVYHARAGALAQARHVFLGGNGLPGRWQGRPHFNLLETGFGLGHNFLATWDAWRADPRRCERLHYVGIELHPPTREDLGRVHADSPLRALADELLAQWPPATPNLHRLAFDGGRVELLLALFDVRDVLPELVATVDAFYLDGFAPARNPAMWERRICRALGRLAAPGATAATWSVARELRDGLAEAGFAVEKAPGFGRKREMSVARYAPAFVPKRPPARAGSGAAPREALIVGGGLAGCAAAWALAAQGIASTLFERRARPAEETSGNAGGVFHGVVTAHDGPHARFHRAAALQAQRIVRRALDEHGVAGAVDGLLRLAPDGDAASLHATLDALGLPAVYAQALEAPAAGALAGLPLGRAALFYPGGGWVDPAGFARALLAMAGAAATWRGGVEVAALRRDGDGWTLLDAHGEPLARGECVVLANHADALRLLGAPAWPLARVRGQTTGLPAAALGADAPRLPLTGHGYVLPPSGGLVWCGATSDAGDADAAPRAADHARNLAQLASLLGRRVEVPTDALQGRVGWRLVADDRLPLLGPVPDAQAAGSSRLDQPRFVPRDPGLHVFTALASRGLTTAALGAQALAALIAGTPCPLEASLLDAVDVARFAARAARRG